MKCWPASLLLGAALLGGCAPTLSPRVASAEVDAALVSAARQVTRCYRAPRVSSEGRLIVTRLRIRLTADGQVAQLPSVVIQDNVTPENQLYAERMAAAAIEAVMRCAPLQLPAAFYANGWAEFELTFAPLARS